MSDPVTGENWLTAVYGFAPQANLLRGKKVDESSIARKAYGLCARISDNRRGERTSEAMRFKIVLGPVLVQQHV